jgi:hypothetical protein
MGLGRVRRAGGGGPGFWRGIFLEKIFRAPELAAVSVGFPYDGRALRFA